MLETHFFLDFLEGGRRAEGAVLTDAEFRNIQCAALLFSDLQNAPAVPSTASEAVNIIAPLSMLMRQQIRSVGEILVEISKERDGLGIYEAERLARMRVDGLDGAWAKAFGHGEVDHLFESILSGKFDRPNP